MRHADHQLMFLINAFTQTGTKPTVWSADMLLQQPLPLKPSLQQARFAKALSSQTFKRCAAMYASLSSNICNSNMCNSLDVPGCHTAFLLLAGWPAPPGLQPAFASSLLCQPTRRMQTSCHCYVMINNNDD